MTEPVPWEMRAQYIRALITLRTRIEAELLSVQQGGPSKVGLLSALSDVLNTRDLYLLRRKATQYVRFVSSSERSGTET